MSVLNLNFFKNVLLLTGCCFFGLMSQVHASYAENALSGEIYVTLQQADTTDNELPPQDTTKTSATDSLKQAVKQELSDVDSTVVEEAKAAGKQAVKDSLDNYVDIPDVPLDSTADEKLGAALKEKLKSETNIGDVPLDSTIKEHVKSAAKAKGTEAIREETGVDVPDIRLDSTAGDQVKSAAKSEAREALGEELGTDIPDIKLDSTARDQVKEEAVRRAEEAMKNTDEMKALDDLSNDSELGKLDDYKGKLEKTQEEIRQAAAKQELKQKMASHAKEYISQNADKIQQVQSQMGELKKKYSYMPNSNDLSSAVKRTSLQEESFWKRLVLGGNFNISKTNPLNIDLAPVVGYRINKLFEAGITGTYRSQFKADKNGVSGQPNDEVYGYSAFASHMAFRNFFGYLEGERMRNTSLNTENPERRWTETLLIGVGRKFNVAKWLEMQAMVLFNVLHDNKDGLYNSPVVFKTGIRVRK